MVKQSCTSDKFTEHHREVSLQEVPHQGSARTSRYIQPFCRLTDRALWISLAPNVLLCPLPHVPRHCLLRSLAKVYPRRMDDPKPGFRNCCYMNFGQTVGSYRDVKERDLLTQNTVTTHWMWSISLTGKCQC